MLLLTGCFASLTLSGVRAVQSQGDILDDSKTVEALAKSKALAFDIEEKQAVAARTEADLDDMRVKYTSVARNACVLFFAMNALQYVDSMYQYSLQWFSSVFVDSILSAATDSDDIAVRCVSINRNFTHNLFQRVSRSLYQRHKLMFSFLVAARMLQVRVRVCAVAMLGDAWLFVTSVRASTCLSRSTRRRRRWMPSGATC
jgi:hypothetical protein